MRSWLTWDSEPRLIVLARPNSKRSDFIEEEAPFLNTCAGENQNHEYYRLGCKRHVVRWKATDFLEERVASIFRAESAEQNISVKADRMDKYLEPCNKNFGHRTWRDLKPRLTAGEDQQQLSRATVLEVRTIKGEVKEMEW
jgi:hypothetical protein